MVSSDFMIAGRPVPYESLLGHIVQCHRRHVDRRTHWCSKRYRQNHTLEAMTKSLSNSDDILLAVIRFRRRGHALCIAEWITSISRVDSELRKPYTIPLPFERHGHHSTTHCPTIQRPRLQETESVSPLQREVDLGQGERTHCLHCFRTDNGSEQASTGNILNLVEKLQMNFAGFTCYRIRFSRHSPM